MGLKRPHDNDRCCADLLDGYVCSSVTLLPFADFGISLRAFGWFGSFGEAIRRLRANERMGARALFVLGMVCANPSARREHTRCIIVAASTIAFSHI